ncbi:MAG: stage III sporulation protein SpoIIIAB [Tepidanaerobacteraceae bacterium]|jgi:stage III sporulation protein AB|nr:stage III sporulation protein SpoIIIAB [Tepidanaerobacteraceae bacterium]
MFFKFSGGLMVIISCSMIGFIIAGYYQKRLQILKSLQATISMLETEINYGHSPLPEALRNIVQKGDKEVSKLFLNTMKYISDGSGYTADEAWEKALKGFIFDSNLNNEDIKILTNFGKYLGATDLQDQIKNIKMTLTRLHQQETAAVEEKQKNEKMWKYLGVLSGIMVFLLLC